MRRRWRRWRRWWRRRGGVGVGVGVAVVVVVVVVGVGVGDGRGRRAGDFVAARVGSWAGGRSLGGVDISGARIARQQIAEERLCVRPATPQHRFALVLDFAVAAAVAGARQQGADQPGPTR
jgi:hypothetical protein